MFNDYLFLSLCFRQKEIVSHKIHESVTFFLVPHLGEIHMVSAFGETLAKRLTPERNLYLSFTISVVSP